MRLEDLIKRTFGLGANRTLAEGEGLGSIPGWDSLGHLNLMVAIESAFRIRWTTRELAELQTIGEIRRALAKRSKMAA